MNKKSPKKTTKSKATADSGPGSQAPELVQSPAPNVKSKAGRPKKVVDKVLKTHLNDAQVESDISNAINIAGNPKKKQ